MPEETLFDWIRNSVTGADEAVMGPFGLRRVTYADYTASGRSLAPIEDYIRDAVLPLVRQHPQRVLGHRHADHPVPRGRPPHHPAGLSAATRRDTR